MLKTVLLTLLLTSEAFAYCGGRAIECKKKVNPGGLDLEEKLVKVLTQGHVAEPYVDCFYSFPRCHGKWKPGVQQSAMDAICNNYSECNGKCKAKPNCFSEL